MQNVIAYHILTHKNASQVSRLIEALWHHDDIFVIHIDRRATRELHDVGRTLGASHQNIIVQKPRSVTWGGPDISNLQIEGMAIALRAGVAWRHFINLTGQDFPLTARPERLNRLGLRGQATYLEWFSPMETTHWSNARERIERYHFHSKWLCQFLGISGIGRRVRALFGWTDVAPFIPMYRRRAPDFLRYHGGSNYGVFSREACQYLTSDPVAIAINRWLQVAGHPDEIVFQTALLGSPLCASIVNRKFHTIEFEKNALHPRILTSGDFEKLLRSSALFARKFDEAIDTEILRLLESHISAK